MKWHFKKDDNKHIGNSDSALGYGVGKCANDLMGCMYDMKGVENRDMEISTVASAWQLIACVEAVIRSHDKDVIEAGREKYDSMIAERKKLNGSSVIAGSMEVDGSSELGKAIGDLFDLLCGGDDE